MNFLDPFVHALDRNLTWRLPALMVVAAVGAAVAAAFVGLRLAQSNMLKQLQTDTSSTDALGAVVATRALPETEDDQSLKPHDLVMQSLNIPLTWARPWHIHTTAVLLVWLITAIAGMAAHLSILMCVMGLVVSQRFMSQRWHNYIMGLETHLPLFISQLASSLSTSNNFAEALELCTNSDSENEADRYFRRLLDRYRSEGRDFLPIAIRQAQHISRPLVTTLYLLKRTEEQGGTKYLDSLHVAANRMLELQDARMDMLVQGARARGVLIFLMVILISALVVMINYNPTFQEAYQQPVIRIVGVVLAGIIVLGYFIMEQIVQSNLKS